MGFFSELKKDLSTAVDEMGDEENLVKDTSLEETAESVEEVDLDSMLNHLDELSSKENIDMTQESAKPTFETQKETLEVSNEEETNKEAPSNDFLPKESEKEEEQVQTEEEIKEEIKEETAFEKMVPESVIEEENFEENLPKEDNNFAGSDAFANNYNSLNENTNRSYNNTRNGGYNNMMDTEHVATDETASITEGMVVNGDIQTTGSLDLIGKVIGNVTAYGKLNVTGEIEGNSNASEIMAEAARINGDIHSQGSVKIGQSSVIIGNIYATSAVIAGAVKGDIDVHGPVVLDTTAIVMGNIKSQSVQINNGAVIEGMCSQTYAEVNPTAFFEGLKNND